MRETAENVPAAQTVQEPAPAFDEIKPKGHGLQCEDRRVEKSPAGQLTHVAGDVAAVAADAVPAEQGKHVALDEAARLSEYVPGGHETHCPGALLPYVPLGQFEHADAEPVENFPTSHCRQYAKPEFGEYVPDGHAKHAASEVAPIVGLYVPAGQSVQEVAWAALAYDPDGQGAQAPEPRSKGLSDDGF